MKYIDETFIMATYLVTGGCGYLGSRLVGHLIGDGHYVRVLDNLSYGVAMSAIDCIDLRIGNVCCAQTVDTYMEGVDGCFHLADVSESGFDKHNLRDIKITLAGGFNIFSAAAKHKVKVVYISSSAIYGDNADLPLNEQAEACPLTAYAADKRALELHAKVASIMESTPTVGLRLFNVYGERYECEGGSSDAVAQFVECVINNRAIEIFGDGEQVRDYVYVEDAIHFIMSAMAYRSTTAEIFNVCSGEGISINDLVRRIMCMTQILVPTHYRSSRSGDIYGSVGCPKKSEDKLHCKVSITINTGLKKLIDFYSRRKASAGTLPVSTLSIDHNNIAFNTSSAAHGTHHHNTSLEISKPYQNAMLSSNTLDGGAFGDGFRGDHINF